MPVKVLSALVPFTTWAMSSVNDAVANAPALSVALTWISSMPAAVLGGVPEKVLVMGLKVSQKGNAAPLERLALNVKTSPASISIKVLDGMPKLNATASVACWPIKGKANTGLSLVLATVNANTTLTDSPASLVAVTRICRAPTCALSGVPANCPFCGLKRSQAGKAPPL